jgi:membrane-associated protease RseP (regulator of RpoE activity)
VSGTTPLLIPNPSETYTTYHSGTVAGSSYSGTSTTIVPGGYTALGIPYSVNRYDFFAAYWVKLKPLAFGAHVGDMPEDLRQKLQRNRGAYVAFVVKGSPAFNADILRGDVITRIGDDEIIDSKSVIHLINKYAGQEVPLEFIRNGETRKISIKLRERSQ